MKAQIAQIVRDAPKSNAGQTYYYELDQTYYSVTSSTFIGKVLGLLGLRNIADRAPSAASSGGYPQLSAEFIVQSNPDWVFLADTICCGQSARTRWRRGPGWSTVKAVRKGQVVGLNDDIASRWGPRIVDLLQTVEAALEEASRRDVSTTLPRHDAGAGGRPASARRRVARLRPGLGPRSGRGGARCPARRGAPRCVDGPGRPVVRRRRCACCCRTSRCCTSIRA